MKMIECLKKRFNLWLLQVIGLLGLLTLCMWLILRPKDPSFTIVSLSVPSLPAPRHQPPTLNYTIEVTNQNTDSNIYYDEFLLSFNYSQATLAKSNIPAFSLGKSKQYGVMNGAVVNIEVLRDFVRETANATAELQVDLLTRVRYNTWGIKSKLHQLQLQASVTIDSDGKMLKHKKVKLHALKKCNSRSKSPCG